MTDVQNTINAPTPEQAIASLKKQADRMGVNYKENVSVVTLQKAIQAKIEENEDVGKGTINGITSKAQPTEAEILETAYDKAMKLHRVIITPLESSKATNLESELFCAGNSLVGTVKRTIPFGDPWHVEHILLNAIREKKYQQFTVRKNAKGVEVTSSRLVPAYAVATLDPLTEDERNELVIFQQRTRSLEDD